MNSISSDTFYGNVICTQKKNIPKTPQMQNYITCNMTSIQAVTPKMGNDDQLVLA